MLHRKWREIKQQLIGWLDLALLGCCLVDLHFLCDILSGGPVYKLTLFFQCEPISGLGFRRGSYKCVCRIGFYFPDTESPNAFFNGTTLEEEYAKRLEASSITSLSFVFDRDVEKHYLPACLDQPKIYRHQVVP